MYHMLMLMLNVNLLVSAYAMIEAQSIMCAHGARLARLARGLPPATVASVSASAASGSRVDRTHRRSLVVGMGRSIPVFFIICFVCLGLKETSVALSDPFGMDAVDFETDVFMARIMINTKELISRQANYVPKLMPLPPDVQLTPDDPVTTEPYSMAESFQA